MLVVFLSFSVFNAVFISFTFLAYSSADTAPSLNCLSSRRFAIFAFSIALFIVRAVLPDISSLYPKELSFVVRSRLAAASLSPSSYCVCVIFPFLRPSFSIVLSYSLFAFLTTSMNLVSPPTRFAYVSIDSLFISCCKSRHFFNSSTTLFIFSASAPSPSAFLTEFSISLSDAFSSKLNADLTP